MEINLRLNGEGFLHEFEEHRELLIAVAFHEVAGVVEHEEFGGGFGAVQMLLKKWAGFWFDVRIVVGKNEDEFFAVVLDFFEVEGRGEKVGERRTARVVVCGGDDDGEIDRWLPVEFECAKDFSAAETVTDDDAERG